MGPFHVLHHGSRRFSVSLAVALPLQTYDSGHALPHNLQTELMQMQITPAYLRSVGGFKP
jgi:hypothetical protein